MPGCQLNHREHDDRSQTLQFEFPLRIFYGQVSALRPTIIVPENRTGFFNTLAGFFSRGRSKTSPTSSMSYWSIFERNLVGLADFAGSNSNGWPTGPVSIKKSKLGELYETGGLFRAIHPVSIKKTKLGQLVIHWYFEPAKSTNPARFLSKIDQ